MKKLFSLLFVALMAMSAWADITVTFVPGTTTGSNTAASSFDQMSLDGVTITCTSGAFAASPYRFAGGSKATVSSTVGNIKKVEFTCQGSYGQSYGPDQFYGDGYTCHSGSRVGTWTGDAASFQLNTASQVRCSLIVVTIGEEPLQDLVAPVFNPNGGEFTGSLEVSLSCATENADIFYWIGTEEEQGEWIHYSTPFYVTETTTYTAVSTKGSDMSDCVTVTFTKVEQTVEAPVFTPATCSFQDRMEVTLACATPGAKIYYSLDGELWSLYSDAIPVTETITIWAKAVVGDVESQVVSATYTKLPATTVEVTFDGSVDKGDGDEVRHHYTVVKEPVTMYVGDGTVYPTHYRIYSSDTAALNFTSTGAPIIKIEFNGMSGNTASGLSLAEGNEGTWTTGGTDGVWEGSAQYVAFKVNRQVRCTSIIVTLAGQDEPEALRGDVNGDKDVSIADVTALIDYLLSNDATGVNLENADCNLDDDISIADVTALIDYLLSNTWGE